MENIEHKTLREIFKYENHPNIITIQNQCKRRGAFGFTELEVRKEGSVSNHVRNLHVAAFEIKLILTYQRPS